MVVAVGADVPLRSGANRLRSADQHGCAWLQHAEPDQAVNSGNVMAHTRLTGTPAAGRASVAGLGRTARRSANPQVVAMTDMG